jgi:uncharacterized damage-inducible protein DinB
MTVNDYRRLYDYGYWANRKLFSVASQLTQDEFIKPVAGSYGSVRNTLVHTMSAEWGWLGRCGGPERGERLKADDFPTLESLTETWDKVESDTRKFLSMLEDEDLGKTIEFAIGDHKGSMPMGELLHHAANHSVHHRGQVALLLRLLGYTPGNFDILFYYGQKHR